MLKTSSESTISELVHWVENQEPDRANEEQRLRLETLRLKDGETIKVAKRILLRIEPQPNGCLKWIGGVRGKGYGAIRCFGRKESVHRFVFLAWVSEIPNGMWVLHRCDNPPCCNPDHLFLGTHMDNVRDAQSKNRLWRSHGELNGFHKLTWNDVKAIRERYKFRSRSGNSLGSIAKDYGVDKTNIHHIVKFRTWKIT